MSRAAVERKRLMAQLPEKTQDGKKYVDYLDQDMPIAGQNFVLLSFVSPDPKAQAKCEISGLKIRGFADSQAEAQQRVKAIEAYDNSFNIFVAPVGVWLPWSPNPDAIENQEYANEQLNDLMKGYRENNLKSQQHFEDRKRKLMEEAILEGTKEGQEKLAAQKEHPIAVKHRIGDLEVDLKELREKVEKMEESLKEANEKLQNDYTQEELDTADKEFEELKKRMESVESQDELAQIHQELREKYDNYAKESVAETSEETSSDVPEIEATGPVEDDSEPIKISEIPKQPEPEVISKEEAELTKALSEEDPWLARKKAAEKEQLKKTPKPI